MIKLSPAATIIAFSLSSATPLAQAATYTVTNNSGGNVRGSLYNAVFQSYYFSSDAVDFIKFNIPGAGPHTIILDGPASFGGAGGTYYVGKFKKSVVVDATTQPGYSGQPLIYIDANANHSAFYIGGGTTNTISGFCIFNYENNAVTIPKESQGNFIQNNWLGFVPTATGFRRNVDMNPGTYKESRGIGISSSFNAVRNNVISGVDNGITLGENPTLANRDVYDALYVTNSITQNYIGTTPDGTGVIGNTSDGIFLGFGAAQNFIGPGNVLSGNDSAGVELLHSSNRGNVIFRNRIGTDPSGTAAIGNKELGVLIAGGATYNVVGGPFGGNVISGNSLGGVAIGLSNPPPGFYSASSIIYVQGNVIGLDVTAKQALNTSSRQVAGISIEGGSTNIIIQDNFIGGALNHSIQAFSSSLFNIENNALGAGVNGIDIPSTLGAGIYLENCNTVYNTSRNYYGNNFLGSVLNNGSTNIFP